MKIGRESPILDFTNLSVCMDCIKGKQTKHTKKGDTRSIEHLEIIHTNICEPFDTQFGKKNLSHLLMFFNVMVISIYCMKNLKQ